MMYRFCLSSLLFVFAVLLTAAVSLQAEEEPLGIRLVSWQPVEGGEAVPFSGPNFLETLYLEPGERFVLSGLESVALEAREEGSEVTLAFSEEGAARLAAHFGEVEGRRIAVLAGARVVAAPLVRPDAGLDGAALKLTIPWSGREALVLANRIRATAGLEEKPLPERPAPPPRDPFPGLLNEARMAMSRGDYGESERLFAQAAEMRPDVPEVVAGHGMALAALGRTAEARTVYQRVHELVTQAAENTPGDPNLAVMKAVTLILLDRSEEADTVVEAFIEGDPSEDALRAIRFFQNNLPQARAQLAAFVAREKEQE